MSGAMRSKSMHVQRVSCAQLLHAVSRQPISRYQVNYTALLMPCNHRFSSYTNKPTFCM